VVIPLQSHEYPGAGVSVQLASDQSSTVGSAVNGAAGRAVLSTRAAEVMVMGSTSMYMRHWGCHHWPYT
jgi:hypothetical protein